MFNLANNIRWEYIFACLATIFLSVSKENRIFTEHLLAEGSKRNLFYSNFLSIINNYKAVAEIGGEREALEGILSVILPFSITNIRKNSI